MTNLEPKLFVFLLATFLGLEVIRRVSPLLHTPLMSLTNAISAIAIVAAIQITAEGHWTFSTVLGTLAVIAATINIVGGFWITDRMLKMFSREKRAVINTFLATPLAADLKVTLRDAVAHATATGPDRNSPFVWGAYLIAATLFILSLKWLSHPKTARRGVLAGEIGMALAVIGTLLMYDVVDYKWVLIGIAVGSLIGAPMAIWMPMTAVPQRTALSHAFGALAAGLVGTAHYFEEIYSTTPHLDGFTMGVLAVEVLLGALTFTGSLVAFGKLQELIPSSVKGLPYQNLINFALLGAAALMCIWLVFYPEHYVVFLLLILVSLAFGYCLVMPIGGADMPTVISLLNSYAGLSASLMGFVLDNYLLIIAGALDGSSGLILSIVMCKAMNRSFFNVLFGRMEPTSAASGDDVYAGKIKSATAEDVAMLLEGAQA